MTNAQQTPSLAAVPDSDTTQDLPDEEEVKPSAAELEAAGQNALFADAPAAPTSSAVSHQAQASTAQVDTAEVGTAQADTGQASTAQSGTGQGAEAGLTSEHKSADENGTAQPSQPYRVLARKYRPQRFSELIGQEPMVRTLANAIERDRLAHAFLMTGVRGVGKTTTARLIAKALNCVGPDGTGGPTIEPCGVCEACRAIAEGRHIDVIEMDAASHTGVDDVREIIEAVRYAAVSARYKIYIIDEVHMLTRNAFNALLKTLEEPPAHVKFLFATTEVEKLPVTVLSRTQRFDLRRISEELLAAHFADICAKEGVTAQEEALQIIALAAEGSVRDGLSILDQAIAHADLDGEGLVKADRVRDMLGLADKSAKRVLLAALLEGDGQAVLDQIADQYALGVEPLALVQGVMELVHRLTLMQISADAAKVQDSHEQAALGELADRLTAPQLHRLWQLLLKGHEEVRQAPDPLISAQMALLRVMHASDLPDPGALMKQVEAWAQSAQEGPAALQAAPTASPAVDAPGGKATNLDWEQLVSAVEASGQWRAWQIMRDQVRVIELAPERLVFEQADNFPEDPGPLIGEALFKLTGKHWKIERGSGNAQPSLREVEEQARADELARLRAHPLVKNALEAFPQAELLTRQDNAKGNARDTDAHDTVARSLTDGGRKWS